MEAIYSKNNKTSLTIKIFRMPFRMELPFADVSANIIAKEVKTDFTSKIKIKRA